MKKRILILFLLINSFCIAQPQGFIKNFYGTGGADLSMRDIDTTHDGGYIMCGKNSYPNGNSNFIVIKTDSLGNEQWRFTNTDCAPTTSLNSNEAWKIKETPQNDFVVVSYMSGLLLPNYTDILFVKLDSAGNLVWKKQYNFYGYEDATALDIFEDSTYLLAGRIITGENQILKINYWGDTLWTKKLPYFTNFIFNPREIIHMNNNYFFAGENDSAYVKKNREILCTDLAGNFIWRKNYYDTTSVFRVTDFRLNVDQKLNYVSMNLGNTGANFILYITDTLGNLFQKIPFYFPLKNYESDIFFNDSCLINHCLGNNFDSINMYKYDLSQQQNNNVVNYHADKIQLIKCVVNRKKEVLFIAVFSDGGFSYTILVKTNQSFIGISNIFFEEIIPLHPNPANDFIQIETDKLRLDKRKNLEIKMYDMKGICVLSHYLELKNTSILNTKSIPTGAYTYQIIAGNEILKSGKIIINH